MSVYTDNGFSGRKEYLETLCEEFPPEMVYCMAAMLGPNEDFDGLITSLEDECS